MAAVPFLIFIVIVAFLWAGLFFLAPIIGRALMHLLRLTARALLRMSLFQDAMQRAARLSKPYVAYGPTLLILIVGGAVSIWAGENFADLAESMRGNSSSLLRLDRSIHSFFNAHRHPAATTFFNFFTIVGTPVGLAVIAIIVSIFLVRKGRYRWAAYLIVTSAAGGAINLLLKHHFARTRPDLSIALRSASGFSFPSGHAMGSVVLGVALGYLTYRAVGDWKRRSAISALITTIVIVICLSRMYLGVHWVSDIGAGVVAGLLWASTTTLAYETIRRVRAVRRGSAMRSTS